VKRVTAAMLLALSVTVAGPAQAAEIFGGVFVHDVDTPLTRSGVEKGADVQLGWRGGRIGGTPLQPYVFGSVNTAGDTHYAAAGISAKFGNRVYVRPGLGIAVHTGSAKNFQDPTNDEVEFGSRVVFAPEIGLGAQINERVSVEASWVHLSHAQLFGRQNPGMDNIGVRLNFAF
jgi:lipid A 3-O-deacylase